MGIGGGYSEEKRQFIDRRAAQPSFCTVEISIPETKLREIGAFSI